MLCLNLVNQIQIVKNPLTNNFKCVYLYAKRCYSSNEGPMAVLKERIVSGELKEDPHQQKVVQALQKLYDKVNKYEPKPKSAASGFSWLFKSNSNASSSTNSLKGLYIHGSVGGGKTTLMDLFYDCCKVSKFKLRK